MQIFANAPGEDDYLNADPTTLSEIVAVIRNVETGERVGTINLEHQIREGFNQDDKQRLISIAEVTAVILQNIDHYAHMEQEQQLLHLFEQVAIDGIVGKNWQHSARQKGFAIRARIETIREQLEGKRTPKQRIRQALDSIERQLTEYAMIPERGALARSAMGAVEPIILDDVLRPYAESLCSDSDTSLHLDLNCKDRIVAIDEGAFQAVIEKLVHNSLRELESKGNHGKLTVRTNVSESGAEVLIEDNGPGISAEVRRYYLRKPVPQHLRKGTGEGAIIALFLLRGYKSTLEYYPKSKDGGAVHRIIIPFARSA